ncbi:MULTISPECIES: toxin-antitoxin system YwqK family antitoxin [unclassified Flavobacterium]|jgi:antitoxin component YwqK of YwqJK toxin-antitoxin module|uniref:toxin-antitoxin system YwqK family antitoxin n=1 Tax=unclassified Flavobacterium TaxID=196869 RepID=UPI0025C1644E|nr:MULTISPECIES: hypothetical protein [unclassified Flavobacterium]
MFKRILIIAYLLIFISCEKKEIKYYSNGSIFKTYKLNNNKLDGDYKEFYLNGNIKIIHKFKEGVLIDSSTYYNQRKQITEIHYHSSDSADYVKTFEKGILISEGRYYSNQERGKWKYYYENGKLKMIIEFMDLCGKQYTNQGWNFDKKGNSIKKFGYENYYTLTMQKKNYKVNEDISLKIKYKPILFLNSNSLICMSPKINKTFCNLNNVKLDTIYSANHNFDIKLSFSTKGNKNLRGFIKEFYNKKADSRDSTTYGDRFIYFDIPIKVD